MVAQTRLEKRTQSRAALHLARTIALAAGLLAVVVPAAAADGPAIAPFSGTYQVLSAKLSATGDGSGPGVDGSSCGQTDGTAQYTASITSPQPIDPLNAITSEEGSPTQGQIGASTESGTVSTVLHGCDLDTNPITSCTDASSGTFTGSWGMFVQADTNSTMAKVTWTPPILGVISFGRAEAGGRAAGRRRRRHQTRLRRAAAV